MALIHERLLLCKLSNYFHYKIHWIRFAYQYVPVIKGPPKAYLDEKLFLFPCASKVLLQLVVDYQLLSDYYNQKGKELSSALVAHKRALLYSCSSLGVVGKKESKVLLCLKYLIHVLNQFYWKLPTKLDKITLFENYSKCRIGSFEFCPLKI